MLYFTVSISRITGYRREVGSEFEEVGNIRAWRRNHRGNMDAKKAAALQVALAVTMAPATCQI